VVAAAIGKIRALEPNLLAAGVVVRVVEAFVPRRVGVVVVAVENDFAATWAFAAEMQRWKGEEERKGDEKAHPWKWIFLNFPTIFPIGPEIPSPCRVVPAPVNS
jgi:hypothetical protein